jgi:1-acyl-sn-glycerol-3-phosphate acyltransferase
MIASLMLLVGFVMLGLPVALFGIPWRLVTGDMMPMYRSAMWVLRVSFRLAGIRVTVEGLERVPKGVACIFMANHVSNLDPPALLPLIPRRTSIYLKKSLMKIPILGYAMGLAEFVPVSRDGSVEAAQESVRLAQAAMDKGMHITTFVEGTRSRDGRLQSFKKGPFYLAMESGAPCVPVSISGTESMMRKGSLRITPGAVRVVFGAPVYPNDNGDREALMAAVREGIAAGLPQWMTETGRE